MRDATERKPHFHSWVQSVLRVFLPKDDRFYEWLEAQARIGRDAAVRLADLSPENLETVAHDITAFEHEGDSVVRQLEEALASTFVTPLDREDIQKLSSELDDVLDNAKRTAYSCLLRGVNRPTVFMVEMIELIGEVTELLVEAVSKLRSHDFTSITRICQKVRELESEGDKISDSAIYSLSHDDNVDAKRLLREDHVMRTLEKMLNHAKRVAETLIYVAVKHG